MKYVVTGINRLTGEWVIISSPHSEWKAQLLMEQQKAKNHGRSAYSRLKIEPAVREGNLWEEQKRMGGGKTAALTNVFCNCGATGYLCVRKHL